jgi:preprotein translocase subunit SecF
VPFELIPPGTHYDFIGKWRYFAGASVAVLLLAAAMIPVRGIRLGIDFAGGTELQVRFTGPAEVSEGPIRAVVTASGIAEPSVVRLGEPGSKEFLIRFRSEATPAPEPAGTAVKEVGEDIRAALEKDVGPLTIERIGYVGPRVGAELRRDGLTALGIACVLILAYVGFRFTPRFAPGAVVALIHDVLITAGCWVILGYEFDLTVLAALLAILGYSVNDTIVIYDRIRENMELHTTVSFAEVVNQSVNQTLGRTILTSGATMLAILAMLFVGGPEIRPFSIAMAIGIVAGCYSTIYIASPTLIALERRFGVSRSTPKKVTSPRPASPSRRSRSAPGRP